jgi:hypothetical protein
MDFIRRFNIALVMTKTDILLFDHDWLDQAMAASAQATATASPQPASPATAPTLPAPGHSLPAADAPKSS